MLHPFKCLASSFLPRLAVGLGAFALGACAVASHRHAAPVQKREVGLTDADWVRACSLPAPNRFERFMELTDGEHTMAMRRLMRHCRVEEVIALTRDLVQFQTVAAVGPPADHRAFEAFESYLRAWSDTNRLTFRRFGPHDAYEIILPGRASEPRSVMFVAHGDVVPVNDPPLFIGPTEVPTGWTVPPFAASEADGNLYGRGTEDDKGPIAAAMIALATLEESGAMTDGDIVLVIGMGEEHSWDGMKRYAKAAPKAEHVISIDANFPVVTAESGFVRWGVTAPLAPSDTEKKDPRPVARRVSGGLFLTQVPDHATVELLPGDGVTVDELFGQAKTLINDERAARLAKDPKTTFRVEVERQPDHLLIHAYGRSVHSSNAETGENANWLLASMIRRFDVAPGGVRTTADIIGAYFDGDHWGEKLGIAYEDARMGKLLAAPTLWSIEGNDVTLGINMRRPQGKDTDAFRRSLTEALARIQERAPTVSEASQSHIGDPHTVGVDNPTAAVLLEIFREYTGQAEAQPLSIRGGTYARLFDGAVSFGPSFPERVYRGHGADEFIALDALHACGELYLEAVIRLTGTRPDAPPPPPPDVFR